MNPPTGCPDKRTLESFAAGRLAGAEAQALRLHLDGCAACTATVAGYLADTARQQTSPSDPTAPLRDDLPTAAAEGEGEDQPDNDNSLPFELNFLRAPAKAGDLGRLGNYDVQVVVGRGGMGIVFKAFDTALHRTVAIKVLSPQLATSRKAHRRFLREARAAAGINHPNVVTIHAVEEQAGMPYLVMEYVAGRSLAKRMKLPPAFDLPALLRIATQIAAGLAAAHQQGVIHRDIKPANIMLENGIERVKITDFGLALVAMDASHITSAERVVGTPAYMSPEQVAGQRVDARSDLFGLGCVIFALVAGKSPFHGRHSLEVARKVADYNPPPLHEQYPHVPLRLSAIVTRLLEKNPDARFQTAQEVGELLQRLLALATQDNSQATVPISTKSMPRRRKSRLWIAAIAAALVLFTGGVGAWFSPALHAWLRGDTNPPEQPVTGGILRVARNGDADYRSLGEALNHAGPGATIRVLDDATYSEPLVIDDPARWRGLTVEAIGSATIATKEGPFATVIVRDTPDVTLRGFRVSAASNQHGLFVLGDASRLTIERMNWTQPADSQWANIYFAKGARGAEGAPIRVFDCDITTAKFGVMIGVQDDGGAEFLELQDNRFTGPGTHVMVKLPARQVLIRGNVFIEGRGIEFDPTSPTAPSRGIHVLNNTFYRSSSWVSIAGDAPLEDAVIANNLVLEANRLDFRGPNLAGHAAKWSFRNNWWETDRAENAEFAKRVADLRPKIDVLSRQTDNRDFLRPPQNSPLLNAGAGGDLPSHIGALLPRAPEH